SHAPRGDAAGAGAAGCAPLILGGSVRRSLRRLLGRPTVRTERGVVLVQGVGLADVLLELPYLRRDRLHRLTHLALEGLGHLTHLVLELARHPADLRHRLAHLPADLGQTLRAEEHESDDREEE